MRLNGIPAGNKAFQTIAPFADPSEHPTVTC